MANSADSDQKPTDLYEKEGYIRVQQDKVK